MPGRTVTSQPYSFHEFRTAYVFERRHRTSFPRDTTAESYYAGHLDRSANDAAASGELGDGFLMLLAENRLLTDHRPYCKVHPAVAGMLARTNIDIDCAHLRPTHPVLEVRLPTRDNPMRESASTPTLQSILLAYRQEADPILPSIGETGVTFAVGTAPRLSVWYDFGETLSDARNAPVRAVEHNHLVLAAGRTLQQQLDAMFAESVAEGYRPSPQFIRAALALAVSCYFFIAGEHELVAPDIAPRHVERFGKAASDSERRKVLAESKKLGHNGWHIGREIELPRPVVHRSDGTTQGEPTGGSWESRHSHVRSGHLRRQPSGPRENPEYRIVFIEPTVVRPDLPPAEPTRFLIRGEPRA